MNDAGPSRVIPAMSPQIQTYAALAIVLVAAVWLVWRSVGGEKKPGCGGDCGCATDKFKGKLKR